MIEEVVKSRGLPAEVRQQIVTKSDGVPLFVEELTKSVVGAMQGLEPGSRGSGQGATVEAPPAKPVPLTVPATLQDALMARLDRLSTARQIAQLGATLGREFSYELLQAVTPLSEADVHAALTKLVEAEILYQRGVGEQARYVFKHALIQDTAYQSLLKSTRRQYHQQIARVLEERVLETEENQPELLAHHYTEAGLIEQAMPYWQRAGQKAMERSANIEAISHLTKGLTLLQTLPDSPTRIQQELSLQLALGVTLVATKGHAAFEVARTYTRARELCQHVGETSQLIPVLWGLFRFYVGRAEWQTAHELAEQILRLAQSVQDPGLLIEAHRGVGATLFHFGELVPALAHFKQGAVLYDPQQHRSHALLYGQDPWVTCHTWASRTRWLLGYPNQALKGVYEALTLARELAHPPSQAWVFLFVAIIHQLRREVQAAQEWTEAAITLSREQGMPFWLAAGTMHRGWVLAEQGQEEEGVAQIREGLAAWRAIETEFERPYYLTLLAEAYGKAGQGEKGLTVLYERSEAAIK